MAELRRDNDTLRQRLEQEDLGAPSDARARIEVRRGSGLSLTCSLSKLHKLNKLLELA